MLVWTVMTFIFVITPILENSIVRTILGLPLVLFIPGYVLIAALFPKKDDLDNIERVALSFGLSIATVPLLGLALNFTPFGIRLIPILVVLSIYIAIMTIVAIYRRNTLPEDVQFSVRFDKIYETIKNEINAPKSKVDRILSVILIFSIILAVGTLAYVIVTPKVGEKFTEFYILGQDGKADNYPTMLEVGKNSSVIVGITNHEYMLTNYTLDIILENSTLNKTQVRLMYNSTWEEKVLFTPEKTGDNLKLQFLLYKEDNITAPYRDLHLWVNVT